MDNSEGTLIQHLEALRSTLLRCLVATMLVYPVAYLLAPYLIELLIKWSFPEAIQRLNYFAPLEVFINQLKFALILALAICLPYNLWQIWGFLLPALYKQERRALGCWLVLSSLLFFAGAAFCVAFIFPLLMTFSGSFANNNLQPVLGLEKFLELSYLLILAFGLMFQTPLFVLLSVRFGLISASSLKQKRPYAATLILIAAAILTPPDVISQIMLAIPTYMLFEAGLLFASYVETPH